MHSIRRAPRSAAIALFLVLPALIAISHKALAEPVFDATVTGVWSSDAETPFLPETKRLACIYAPRVLHPDGLIVQFDFGSAEAKELPRQSLYLRCTALPDCAAEPTKADREQGVSEVSPSRIALTFRNPERTQATLCDERQNCRFIARCPPVEWTDEEQKSGMAEAWEALVRTRDE